MYQLSSVNTTNVDKLRTEVEQKTTYALNRCELNIYETHKKVENIHLTFGGFTITSMLKGKKILHEGANDIEEIIFREKVLFCLRIRK